MKPEWLEDVIDKPALVDRFFLNCVASRPKGLAQTVRLHEDSDMVMDAGARANRAEKRGRAPLSTHPQEQLVWLDADECTLNEPTDKNTKEKGQRCLIPPAP